MKRNTSIGCLQAQESERHSRAQVAHCGAPVKDKTLWQAQENNYIVNIVGGIEETEKQEQSFELWTLLSSDHFYVLNCCSCVS